MRKPPPPREPSSWDLPGPWMVPPWVPRSWIPALVDAPASPVLLEAGAANELIEAVSSAPSRSPNPRDRRPSPKRQNIILCLHQHLRSFRPSPLREGVSQDRSSALAEFSRPPFRLVATGKFAV